MSKFKVGDSVICYRITEEFYNTSPVVGKIYTVENPRYYNMFLSNDGNYYLEQDFKLHKAAALHKHEKRSLTLPTESKTRKDYPLLSGCIKYFPAALAGVALISKLGNDKHNPGEDLHHARGKSMDHGDCIIRHLMDTEDLMASLKRDSNTVTQEQILAEASSLVWRALAYSQDLHEQFGAPLAPAAVEEPSK